MDELIGYDPFDDPDIGAMELVGQDDDIDELLDVVGAEDDDWIEGDDDYDDEIGARRRRRGSSRARRAAIMRAKRRKGLYAARSRANAGRQIFFGGNGVQGAAAGVLTMSTKVQELCRVTKLYVVGDDGGVPPTALDPITWSLLDIKVGVKSQFTALESIPGVLFQADNTSQTHGYSMDTVQPGTDFSVQVADAPAVSRFKFAAVAKALR